MSLALLASAAAAFVPIVQRTHVNYHRCDHVRMGLFDSLAAAFEPDEDLGDYGSKSAGLSKKLNAQQITWVGPKPEGPAAFFEKQKIIEQPAMPGTPLMDLAEDAGIPITYSCMKGTCRICDVKINGEDMPACTAKMGRNDVTVEYRTTEDAEIYAKEALKAERMAKKAAKAAAAGGAAPSPKPAAAIGKVTPTNPFGELRKVEVPKIELPNPFNGDFAPPNPFGAKAEAEVQPAQQEESRSPAKESNLELVRRLRMEEQMSRENGAKKKGWF